MEKPDEQIRIEGTIATHRPCLELSVVPIQNEMKGGKVTSDLDIDIDITLPKGADCQMCPSELNYEAMLVFDRFPASLDVFHIDRDRYDGDDGAYRVGPLTQKSFS